MFKQLLGLWLVILLPACAILHTELPSPAPELPTDWSRETTAFCNTSPWWVQFHAPELDALIKQSLAHNLSLQQAWARMYQAEAVVRKTGAERWPNLDGSFGPSHQRTGGKDIPETTSDNFSLGFSAGYEIDLWGRVRASQESASQAALASKENLHAAALSLSGQVARAWLALISIRQQEQLLQRQLELNRDLLDLVQYRFSVSQASALDVYQQQQTVTAIEGSLITARAEKEVRLQQLSFLAGVSPASLVSSSAQDFPKLSSPPPGGLPSDLLAQRPDIRAQKAQLRSSSWAVTEAKADMLPALNLTGAFTFNASVLESLLDAWVLNLTAELAGPIFDGGEKRAEIDRARGVVEEDLATYRETVLQAIYEVEEALVREEQYTLSTANITQQVELTRKAYREATFRYLNGLSDYLAVLREQVNLITSQLDSITNQEQLLANRVTLHIALGGSWPETMQKPDSMSLSTAQHPPEQTP
ncbi:efflux transporter outer membrane subunit [Desulfogranum japonicum]|uniref:efflux transporter outer membrane subunit n=1 Tax=Desulfogranum japonicum TaxID=231447 RepID=UPI00041E4904|nr:efflux transporter outer membrane subunit [Desulfogranum japonicum]